MTLLSFGICMVTFSQTKIIKLIQESKWRYYSRFNENFKNLWFSKLDEFLHYKITQFNFLQLLRTILIIKNLLSSCFAYISQSHWTLSRCLTIAYGILFRLIGSFKTNVYHFCSIVNFDCSEAKHAVCWIDGTVFFRATGSVVKRFVSWQRFIETKKYEEEYKTN
jgi:hypothetical protein